MKSSPALRIVIHYGMASMGFFGLMSTLAVILHARVAQPSQVALLLSIFTIANRVAKLPLAPLVDRLSGATAVLAGCWLAAAGVLALNVVHGLWSGALALAVIGVGASMNALASKQLSAAASERVRDRRGLFSAINAAANLSFAVSAPVSLAILKTSGEGAATIFAAAFYALAGAVTYLSSARTERGGGSTNGVGLGAYAALLRTKGLLPFLAVNALGWVLYAQLFNALALHVSTALQQPARLGWLYSLNALLVVVGQIPLTKAVDKCLPGRGHGTIALSYLLFAAAFFAGHLAAGYAGSVLFVVAFTVAEMMFVPSVDVVFLDLIGSANRSVAYSVLSLSTALGEAVGAGGGVMAYERLAARGRTDAYWLSFGALALVFFACAAIVSRRDALRVDFDKPAGQLRA